jgi:AcrR family transcriptional regulator
MSPLDPRDAVMKKVHLAFLAYGYEHITMIALAKAADMSRRSLYNYFANNEEAFRAAVRWGNARNITLGQMAAADAKATGASALEVLVAYTDARYGETRRELSASPHAVELNDQAFRRCRDIMIDAAVAGQDRLAEIILDLQESGLVRWREGYSAAQLAQHFSDAARGVNQTLPPRPSISLRERYREIFAALLGGVASYSAP